mmetsp:Transcript_7957/g.19642  ORF Transcript_7957/g.19642 Transcript_7957/m.19642 type:complete len:262 (+) Transcript_7957:277-1062(+)
MLTGRLPRLASRSVRSTLRKLTAAGAAGGRVAHDGCATPPTSGGFGGLHPRMSCRSTMPKRASLTGCAPSSSVSRPKPLLPSSSTSSSTVRLLRTKSQERTLRRPEPAVGRKYTGPRRARANGGSSTIRRASLESVNAAVSISACLSASILASSLLSDVGRASKGVERKSSLWSTSCSQTGLDAWFFTLMYAAACRPCSIVGNASIGACTSRGHCTEPRTVQELYERLVNTVHSARSSDPPREVRAAHRARRLASTLSSSC